MLFVSPAYECYTWNMLRIGFMTSEEMSFENIDNGRTTDGWLYYKAAYNNMYRQWRHSSVFANAESDQSVHCVYEEAWDPWLSI